MEETIRKVDRSRDGMGRFIKGSCPNPKGNNQFTSIVPLLEALKKRGKKRRQDFWDMVAEKVWRSEPVLIAILKKLLPDKIAGEGFGDSRIIIIRSNNKKENADIRPIKEHLAV